MQDDNIGAIDWGTKRVGLAYSLSNPHFSLPYGFLENNNLLIPHLVEWIKKYNFKLIIIGKTLSHHKARTVFIKALRDKLPDITIKEIDESYTTVQAEILLRDSKQEYGNKDTLAALCILDYYLNTKEKNVL